MREQGTNALNFQHAGFERAAQEYEQATRDEVYLAVVLATDMSRAETLTIMGAFENEAEQTWT